MSAQHVRVLLVLIVALVVDEKLAPRLAIGGIAPDLVLPALLVVSLRRGPASAAWAGFWCGIFLDVAMPEALGARALSLAVSAFLVARLATNLDAESLPVRLVLIVGMGLADAIVFEGASRFTQPGLALTELALFRLPELLYTLVLSAPLLLLLRGGVVPARAGFREGL